MKCIIDLFFIELPNMTNGKIIKLLREWDGDKNSMNRILTIKLIKPVEKEENENSMETN